jgi:hypothetical protein
MSLQGVARGNVARARPAMTGLGAADYRVPINRHVRPACSPIKHSSNGLHDTLQRALGPDLGHSAVHVYSLSVANPLCRLPTPEHVPPVLSLSR